MQRLPVGDWILFSRLEVGAPAAQSEVVVVSPASGDQKVVRSGGVEPRYLPSGHLVYVSGGVLYAAPFDLARLEVTGGAVPVVEGVRMATTPPYRAQFDVSETGTLVYIPGPVGDTGSNLVLALADRSGETIRLDAPPRPYNHVRASPDGRRLALDSDDGIEAIIWVYDLGSRAMNRLTQGGRDALPVWSPDGERVAFQSDRDGDVAIYTQRIDGTGGVTRLTTPAEGEVHVPESWSPDGKYLSYSVEAQGLATLWILSLDDLTSQRHGTVESTEPIGSVFSPSGGWIAYHALPPGAELQGTNSGVYVEPFPATGARYHAPKVRIDFQPMWSPDGSELLYIASTGTSELVVAPVSTASGATYGNPDRVRFPLTAGRLSSATRGFDILPDGRFVGFVPDTVGNTGDGPVELRLVVNWFEELERLVPTH